MPEPAQRAADLTIGQAAKENCNKLPPPGGAMDKLGFIGLGVMGEPMCRNLARRQRGKVLAHDLRPEPLKRVALDGVAAARSIAELAAQADVIFLSLPGEPQVRAVGLELSLAARAGQAIVDCSTAPVALARELASRLTERGAHFADAP